MKFTTTLQRIRDNSPCEDGYKKLVTHLGGCKSYGMDTPINLLTILDANGVEDTLWCLRATAEDSRRTAAKLAIEFAAEALPIFEARYPGDMRVREAIQGARDYMDGKITLTALKEAQASASFASFSAVNAAAYAAADDADAANAAAAAAAYAARERQAEIIRAILA